MITIPRANLHRLFLRHRFVIWTAFLLFTIVGALFFLPDSLLENRRLVSLNQPTDAPRATLNREEVKRLNLAAEESATHEREDQFNEAAEFFNLKRSPDGQSPIPVERYFVAQEHIQEMPRYTSATGRYTPSQKALGLSTQELEVLGTWTPLGPGNIGGRTRALVIHPTTPNTMYAAGVAGGVWKTTNGGTSWTPLADLIANIAVNSLAIDPTNSNILYAGTGESFAGDGVRGAGIFKTTDGGTNWTRLANTNTSNFFFVNDLVVSPNSGQRVYAATEKGLFRSLDGDTNWTSVLSQSRCTDLVIRTDQGTDYLFASCQPGGQGTIYRNTDAGAAGTWTAVLTEAGMGRASLALAPSNQNVIYALAASTVGGTGGNYTEGLHAVFRSTGSGATGTWTAQVRNSSPNVLNTLLLTNPLFAFQACVGTSTAFFNQGSYDNVIAVDPLDSNRVWTGGVDLFRSDDGGANWGIASYWWENPTDPQYAHADQHAIVFHPQYNGTSNRIMYVGNDGGLFRTDDARAATSTTVPPCNSTASVVWTSLNNNYGVTQFYHGLPYPNGTTYFGGTQDNGTLRGTDGSGVNAWGRLLGGDGGYVALDPNNTNILYAENFNLSLRKSTNGGTNFSTATNGITEAATNFLFITPFLMDPTNAQRLWIGGRSMWRTDNAAGNWVQASTQITSGGISAIAVAPTNPNIVLVGANTGRIARTTVGTTATSSTVWTNHQTPRGTSGQYISWLTFDPTNANIAYATVASFNAAPPAVGHVFKSVDGGQTWASIDGAGATGIPDIPVHCIIVDPTNTARLYLGTDLGVFVSTDGGANWAVENTGFANVVTESLAVNSVAGTPNLFAFTHGRGAWRVSTAANACPTVTSINPTSGAVGSSVTINGANLTGVTVRFSNNINATITNNTGTQLTVTVPVGAVTGPITVSKAGCNDVQTSTFTVTTNNPCTNPSPITVGQTVNGQLSAGDCVLNDGSFADLYSFSGTTGQQIAISLNSSAFNAYLLLANPSGTVIVQNDDGGGGTNARIPAGSGFFTLPATGTYTIYANSLTAGQTGSYALTLSGPGGGGGGLQFYPLANPVRLLDTRPGASPNACSQPNVAITGGTALTQPARNFCGLPASAQAITGNVTTVQSGGGYLTLYPSDASQPTVASTNFNANEIINNVFTVGLGASDGAFKIFALTTTHVVVDVTGYYAPPGTGGLYFHPLPAPVRLLETRAGLPVGCFKPGVPIPAGGTLLQQGNNTCGIPAGAQALVGNATSVFPSGGGYLTLFPNGAAQPTVAASNYNGNDIVNGPFTVGLGTGGQFRIFSAAATHLVVDILGYYSTEANDVNGAGLLFNQLARPVRLLETRTNPPTLPGCIKPGLRLVGTSTIYNLATWGTCDGLTIPDTARGIVGNATVVFPSNGGYMTFWPFNTTQPTVATSNFLGGQIYNRHFIVGLDSIGGRFNIFFEMGSAQFTTDLVIDVSGYFAP